MPRYSYDRRTASGPSDLKKVLDKRWNDLHDLENELENAAQEFDQAASYAGGAGRQAAQGVLKAVKDAVKAIQALADSGGALDKLAEAERDFVKKFGDPDQYIREQQDKMGLS
jgi:hypothetical protein